MKLTINIFLMISINFGCNIHKQDTFVGATDMFSPINYDTSQNNEIVEPYDKEHSSFYNNMDSISKLEGCPLVNLPFSYDNFYYKKLVKKYQAVCKIQMYNNIQFYPLLSKSYVCQDSMNLDTTSFNFKYARIKLPDVFSYKVYIVSDTVLHNYGLDSKTSNSDCVQYWRQEHAYLILNDTLNYVTKIISLVHPSPSRIDNPEERTFSISVDYEIVITNYGPDEDFFDLTPYAYSQIISILPDGKLQFSNRPVKK